MNKNKEIFKKILIIFSVSLILVFVCLIVNNNNLITAYGDESESSEAFDIDYKTLIKYNGKATSVTIPTQIETIAAGAFRDNTSIVDVIINSNTTKIEQNAFYGCSNLKNITFGQNSKLISIGFMAFARCGTLREINLPSSLVKIDDFAFFAASQLNKIELPENLEYIGKYAFMSCINVETFEIPQKVLYIGMGAFNYCIKNIAINVDGKNDAYYSSNGVLYSKDMKTLYRYPAGKTLTSFSVQAGTEIIAKAAFWDNRFLQTITFPSSLISWENGAINDRSENTVIKTINLPDKNKLKENADKACLFCPNLIINYI